MVVQERLTQEPLPQISTAVESLDFEQTEDAHIETLYETVCSRQKNRHRRFDDDLLLCMCSYARGLQPLKCVNSIIEANTTLEPLNDVFTPAITQRQGCSSHRVDRHLRKGDKGNKGGTRTDVKGHLHNKLAKLTARAAQNCLPSAP